MSPELENSIDYTIRQMTKALAEAMEVKDPYVRGHSEQVAELAKNIGYELDLSSTEVGSLWLAGVVHDVGKVGIAGEILNKPGPLTKYEQRLVESHVELSLQILTKSSFPREIMPIVAQHHERLNGSGYPKGLKKDEIVLGGRILGVADVFHAMTSARAYRPPLSQETAIGHLIEHAGILYDPTVIDALIKVIKGTYMP